jgi:hypothetical protein
MSAGYSDDADFAYAQYSRAGAAAMDSSLRVHGLELQEVVVEMSTEAAQHDRGGDPRGLHRQNLCALIDEFWKKKKEYAAGLGLQVRHNQKAGAMLNEISRDRWKGLPRP